MTQTTNLLHYEKRFKRVTDYIHAHLDEEIDLNTLADVAHMSPYHWHRIYHGFFGETIAATVKRLRLERAAYALAHSDSDIDLIARQYGYPNRQSFTRIFKAAYGMPPATYRTHGAHIGYQTTTDNEDTSMYDVAIKPLPLNNAVGIQHSGDYLNISHSFEHLFTWLGVRNLVQPDMRLLGVYYDDINSIAPEQLRSHACVLLNQPVQIEDPVESVSIAAGDYAVLTHKGPYSDLKVAYDWLFGQWLVNSGRDAANEPVFEEYMNSPQDTPPTELLTNICLPLT